MGNGRGLEAEREEVGKGPQFEKDAPSHQVTGY